MVTKIGIGKVIRGWDEGEYISIFDIWSGIDVVLVGVPQLSLGQKAILTITPDYVCFALYHICI